MTNQEHPTEQSPRSQLQYALGTPGLIRLDEINSNNEVLHHEVQTPYCVLGRGAECDVRIADPIVSFRHIYLQPIGTRIACADLFTSQGIEWLEGPRFRGWLSQEHVFRIGKSIFRLADSIWQVDEHLKAPTDFRPREDRAAEYGLLATAELELQNTSAKGKRWPINRIITLLGRDKRCRIRVEDERVSRVHCSLLLLPTGLWVIDLLGKGGIQVNGETVPCAQLPEGAELAVGPYRTKVHYTEEAPAFPAFVPPAIQQQGSRLAEPLVNTSVGQTEMPAAQVSSIPALSSVQGEQQFVTRQNRLFIVEGFEDTMIVRPTGDGRDLLYQETHKELSRVSDVITSRKYAHLVVDFSAAVAMGKIALDSLTQMCRATLGRVAFCHATPEVYAELERAGLARIWHHYLTLNDAFVAVHVEPESPGS